MSQIDKIKRKLLLQVNRVKTKFKSSKNREVSNMEIQLASYQYAVSPDARNEYNENQLEWLHDRLCNLNPKQMELYCMKFQEGMSEREIGDKLGVSHVTVHRMLHKMFDDLRTEYEEK